MRFSPPKPAAYYFQLVYALQIQQRRALLSGSALVAFSGEEPCGVMPVKARLRGFEPSIPEDFQVIFCDELPPDAVCAQCDNVSATLHRDTKGHGYCTSCIKMCTNDGLFQCYRCAKAYRITELKQDKTTTVRIDNQKIICPMTVEGKPVHIPFGSLKDHLKWCTCSKKDNATEEVDHQSSVPAPDKKSACPYCDEKVTKKEVFQHVKNCRGKHNELHQQQQHKALSSKQRLQGEKISDRNVSYRQEDTKEAAGVHAKECTGSSNPEENQTETLTEINNMKAEITKIYVMCAQSQSKISDQQKKIEELEEALGQKDSDIQKLTERLQSAEVRMVELEAALGQKDDEIQNLSKNMQSCDVHVMNLQEALSQREHHDQLLTETVTSIQTDLHNIHIRCEQQKDIAEKTACCVKAVRNSLREEMSTFIEGSEKRMHLIEAAQKNMMDSLTAELDKLREECKQSRDIAKESYLACSRLNGTIFHLKASHDNLQACFDNCARRVFPAPPEPGQFAPSGRGWR
ncbi:uncharacterized protein LOC144104307 isoform X2 [Amblyomma americanum]